jgi:hypothetical protein
VSLVLVVLIFSLIPSGTFGGNRKNLEESVLNIQRAVRFSVDEAILRNSMTRVLIDLDAEQVTYSVEYGPGAGLVLPEVVDESKLSISEKENQTKVLKGLNSQFKKVSEFSEEDKKLPEGIRISGVASSYLSSIKMDGKVAIYFYPTGERDNALIFFTSEDELASLDIPPFEDTTRKTYYTFTESEKVNFEDSVDVKMREMFESWLKE